MISIFIFQGLSKLISKKKDTINSKMKPSISQSLSTKCPPQEPNSSREQTNKYLTEKENHDQFQRKQNCSFFLTMTNFELRLPMYLVIIFLSFLLYKKIPGWLAK